MSLHRYKWSPCSCFIPILFSYHLNNKWLCLYSEAIQPTTSDCLALICCSGDYPGKIFSNYMFLMINALAEILLYVTTGSLSPARTHACHRVSVRQPGDIMEIQRSLSYIHPAGRLIKGLSWCFLIRKHEQKLFLLHFLLFFVLFLFSTERLQSNKCNTAEWNKCRMR